MCWIFRFLHIRCKTLEYIFKAIYMKGVKMPYISIETFEGKTVEQKKALIQEVTKAVTSTLNVPPESVWIVIKDVPRCNWGEKGQPIS
ncbi:hypothetical protein LCGC14_0636260 [marine sediment metagenome]|uniref:4-oxalocrotonate tautomerase-like domain-containing protein n=1 Tax=marine sediment metagenome TaxID=412755 RepID=A0A0F9R0D3_9ZZZZ